jgi:site-specific recombinase XerD
MGGERSLMITDYVRAPDTVARMRVSCVGPYLDHLTTTMAQAGFKSLTIIEHLRTVVQLATWAERRGVDLACWDENILAGFRQRLARRKLAKRDRALGHAVQFLAYLRARGVIAPATPAPAPRYAPILELFASWMVRHRGATPHTLDRYRRVLEVFVEALGEDPAVYDVSSIRAFVVDRLGRRDRGEAREVVTAIRSFLRFLVADGKIEPRSGTPMPAKACSTWARSAPRRFQGGWMRSGSTSTPRPRGASSWRATSRRSAA